MAFLDIYRVSSVCKLLVAKRLREVVNKRWREKRFECPTRPYITSITLGHERRTVCARSLVMVRILEKNTVCMAAPCNVMTNVPSSFAVIVI